MFLDNISFFGMTPIWYKSVQRHHCNCNCTLILVYDIQQERHYELQKNDIIKRWLSFVFFFFLSSSLECFHESRKWLNRKKCMDRVYLCVWFKFIHFLPAPKYTQIHMKRTLTYYPEFMFAKRKKKKPTAEKKCISFGVSHWKTIRPRSPWPCYPHGSEWTNVYYK